jgi:hypothetical protein
MDIAKCGLAIADCKEPQQREVRKFTEIESESRAAQLERRREDRDH